MGIDLKSGEVSHNFKDSFPKKNKRLIILAFGAKPSAVDLAVALRALPAGAVVIGVHYNSSKHHFGLIVSHWAFDPVMPNELIPEYMVFTKPDNGQVCIGQYDVVTEDYDEPQWMVQSFSDEAKPRRLSFFKRMILALIGEYRPSQENYI